jgi:hypothetical protein
MSATNITPTTRFFAPNVTRVVFCTSVAVKTAPTRSEINAGTDLSNEVNATNGWSVGSNLIDAPDLGTLFTSKVAGRTESPDSSLTMYQSLNNVDARSLLPRTTTGFILIMWGGDVTGRKMDVFPVTVSSVAKNLDDNKASDMQINFAITSQPAEDVTIP